MPDATTLMVTAASAVVAAVLLMQVRRLWRIRSLLRKFLTELHKLNRNLETIKKNLSNRSNPSENMYTPDAVCQNCRYRLTFYSFESPDIFMYKCKLDNKIVSLTDTCNKFQKYLQNSRI